MNKRLTLCAVLLGTLPAAALAAPTVTFQGEVTEQTCQVMINGQTNGVVLLPTVSIKDFDSSQTAGLTPFTVSVSGCTKPTDSPVNIKTVFLGYNVDTDSGVLGNSAENNPAVGFGIQLMDGNAEGSSAIKLSGATAVPGLTLAVDAETAEHTFGAQYYLLDSVGAKAGKITAVAEYTISYF